MRKVILHYHIYKNSGTSFDHVLTQSFGAQHELFDGPFPFFSINQDELDRIITRRPSAVAFSSHQIMLPQPTSLEYRALAVLFLRHPILRIGSIWRFKRESEDGTTTSDAAQQMSFAEWIEWCFADPQEISHISNAQTRFLAAVYGRLPLRRRTAIGIEYDLETARRNLRQVEFLARTEFFEQDVARFPAIAAQHGLTLTLPDDLHMNATHRAEAPLEERVAALLAQLPGNLAARLIQVNAQDQALFDLAGALIEKGQPE
ncbi:MAG: sulfotransferase family 2 domain-containing protein [Paracoccus sp. (in: a-proteobacteria)]|uniref:sulfotransferase family 2 domain-containing protein n=1 Tax=Paracoccus sp. TaxID=267 RepID=UPI0026E093D5|nr:sulfotransferase family 2 domain-containing protein [Paracoccus sp. (in: a-proteobacteria)]MDO5621120.1 sulfotransferase family 2 domain-containing protein [Paracoccus sp. (in: a-proteobacteria)]